MTGIFFYVESNCIKALSINCNILEGLQRARPKEEEEGMYQAHPHTKGLQDKGKEAVEAERQIREVK